MKAIKLFIVLCVLSLPVLAQDIYFTKTAVITFDSSTPLETIHAVNQQSTSFINFKTGEINFAALVRSFKFKNSLMEEHFNENFVESDKFPKAVFKGKILNIEQVDLKTQSAQTILIEGELTFHDVSKMIKTQTSIIPSKEGISASASFIVTPDDFEINIPNAVKDKIAKEVKVLVEANYQPYKK